MIFDDFAAVDQVCYDLKLGDYPRARNRARINDLFNGLPPLTDEEAEKQNVKVNFNDLTATVQGHDARSQLYSAFHKTGNCFTLRTDMGTKHKRTERGIVATKEANRILNRSLPYYECRRSKLALDVLHGVGPACWNGPEKWCPDPLGIEDVLIPAGTFLTMSNLDRFALYRSYSYPELVRLTNGPDVDPGWDKTMLEAIKKWFKEKAAELMGNNWPAVWSPDKLAEGVKEDTGFYMGDRLPTLDVFDFYFWSDEKDGDGWYRRIILDAWNTPLMASGGGFGMQRRHGELFKKDGFLYTSGDRKVADKWSEIVSFQFADLSAVAPFRYHSVRSLGWLLFATCMWQNLLRCKFNEHVFENLMQYFRVKSFDDYQRALKVELINRGFIDETIQMVPQSERWQINYQIVDAAFQQWDSLIKRSSASYYQRGADPQDKTRKTAQQYMGEVNATASLVGMAFEQAYRYQAGEYNEIKRRFMRWPSTDPEVNKFRANCLRQGIPESMLKDPDAWDLEPERTMGAGNKTIEVGVANWLMEHRPLYDPEPQQEILRQATLLVTDDPAFTNRIVPEKPVKITDAVHDAQLTAGVLMGGLPVSIKTGMNHIEYVETMLMDFDLLVKGVEKRGGMATAQEIFGFQNLAGHIAGHIQIIAQDEGEKQRVKQYQDTLAQLLNMVKAYAQRLQEQKAKGNGQLQMDPKDAAKIQATQVGAQVKAQSAKESHAARTAQRQIAFEQKMRHDEEKHKLEVAATDLKTASEIRQNRLRSLNEPKSDE